MYFSTGAALQAALSALPPSKTGVTAGHPAGYTAFDPFFYGTTYMQGYSGSLTPIDYFVQIGAVKGDKPNASFDPAFYLSQYPDLQGKGLNAADLIYHFMQFGLDEGRVPNAALANFNAAAYLAAYPDVAAYVNANLAEFGGSASNGALAHYVKFGEFDGHTLPSSRTFTLTTNGPDNLVGTAFADTFLANIVQNINGEQTNQLATGDHINGGPGVDTLYATVQMASPLNNYFPTQAITPITTSIEQTFFTAMTMNQSALNTSETVVINAKSMTALTDVGSLNSDASLTIENLTTLTDSGAYANRSATSSVTIHMDHTGNAQALDAASNMTVLFDNDYLLAQGQTNSSTLELRMANAYSLAHDNAPLTGFTAISFSVGATAVVVDVTGLTTYAAVAQAIRVQLTAQHITDITVVVDPVRQVLFSDDVGGYLQGSIAGNYTPITLTSTSDVLAKGEIAQDNSTINANFFNTELQVASSVNKLITSPVDLFKVGRGADGGSLTIGGMATDLQNNFGYVTSALASGVQQFDVTVQGDATQFSSLSSLRSTNNTLKVVNVVTDAAQTGTYADLTIGNSATYTPLAVGDTPSSANANALKDVQTFDASGLKGDLTLFAALTGEVTAKYLNVVDVAANAAADNVAFVYTGGTGNDYINLHLDPSNLALPGTATREDMTLIVSGGTGNDEIVVHIDTTYGEGPSGGSTPNWYANQHINANDKIGLGNSVATGQLQLNGNDGNDTIRNIGTGDFAINGGAGNDTIYSDQTGVSAGVSAGVMVGLLNNDGRAIWVFNDIAGAGSHNVNDLLSQPVVAAQTLVANLSLHVDFKGYTATAVVGGSNVTQGGVSINDLSINQAIKDAINGDPVLSKLLIAEDGPSRTLVVRDLIDGTQSAHDVAVSLVSTALTPSQIALGTAHLITDTQAGNLGFGPAATLVNTYVTNGLFDSLLVTDGAAHSYTGGNSVNISDSLIVGGTGNDVIVLSTGALSNEGVGYAGLDNGTDSIVNFVTSTISNVLTGPFDTTSIVIAQGAAATTGSAAVAEVFTLSLTGTAGTGAGAIAFDDTFFGTTTFALTPTVGETAAAIATALITGFNAEGGTVWTASAGSTAGSVVFTAQTAGAGSTIPTIANTGAQITYDNSGVGMTDVLTTAGAATVVATGATAEVVTVTFANATLAATYTFDGVSVAVLAGETGANIAAAFNSVAAGGLAGWTHTNAANSANLVLTSTTPGALTDLTNASFVGANVMVTTPTVSMAASDHLDFSSYGAKAVYVGATLAAAIAAAPVQGSAVTALGQNYIVLVESATNAGSYTMTEYVEAGALGFTADTSVGVIGVADFGAHQAFVAANFVLA